MTDAHETGATEASTGVDRRTALLGSGAAALFASGLAAAPAAHAATTATATGTAGSAAANVLPSFTYLGRPLPDSLVHDPTGEQIFPCIRGTGGRLSNAPGRFLLYYAPHDPPGGICVAYADDLEATFTDHPGNPIVSRQWGDHYSVSHVSSPHVLWNAEHREMWLYFHGENHTTRLARSSDGLNFTYEGVVLTTDMVPGTTEASYARVFEHRLPDRDARYVMVFMRNNSSGDNRSIGWGWSADGITFDFDPDPLVSHSDLGLRDLSSPHLVIRGGSVYVVYHTDQGDIRMTEVGQDFSLRNHLGVVHTPMEGAPDSGRSAAPSYASDGGTEYMFYEAGSRLQATIAVARAD
jgi:hypothetical protein